MKKLLSYILVLTIIFSWGFIWDLKATADIRAISIDEIPWDWEGYYTGFSDGPIARGAEIYINAVR